MRDMRGAFTGAPCDANPSSRLIVAATAIPIGPGRALVPSKSTAPSGATPSERYRAQEPGPVLQNGTAEIAGLGDGLMTSTERVKGKIVFRRNSLTIGMLRL